MRGDVPTLQDMSCGHHNTKGRFCCAGTLPDSWRQLGYLTDLFMLVNSISGAASVAAGPDFLSWTLSQDRRGRKCNSNALLWYLLPRRPADMQCLFRQNSKAGVPSLVFCERARGA